MLKNMIIQLKGDFSRYGDNGLTMLSYTRFLLLFFRGAQNSLVFVRIPFKYLFNWLAKRHGIEISPSTKIGKGFYIGHPYNITINPNAIIGDNVNIHRGVLIGQENRGDRKGTPIIGSEVWIGVNAVIVGKVNIGDNVLIAPNSYVNCDVPSNSVVFGNPCQIKHSKSATAYYVNNKV